MGRAAATSNHTTVADKNGIQFSLLLHPRRDAIRL